MKREREGMKASWEISKIIFAAQNIKRIFTGEYATRYSILGQITQVIQYSENITKCQVQEYWILDYGFPNFTSQLLIFLNWILNIKFDQKSIDNMNSIG